MTKLLLKVALLLLSYSSLFSQEISIIRSDVDSSRKSFVTATMNFRITIKLNNVINCTGISFVLLHNQSEYIKFSNFKPLSFSSKGSVFVYPWINPIDGTERIFTGLLNGDTIGGKGENNPEAIEFEFSVSPDAPNGSTVEFSFENAEAVITNNNIGEIIKLKSQLIIFDIHGFVNVWPGDANNDGIVNINDVSSVGLYLGYGAGKSNFRSFKRLNASTNWFPQSCLAWDSLPVTFADCDGDGEVTINDMLVIPLNFGKTHSLFLIPQNGNQKVVAQEILFSEHCESCSVPMKLVAEDEIIAFSSVYNGLIMFTETNTFSGYSFELCEQFTFYKHKDNKTLLAIGATNNAPLNGKIVGFSNNYTTIFGKGITLEGKIVDAFLQPETNLGINEINFLPSLEQFPSSYQIYNMFGINIREGTINSHEQIKSVTSDIPNGAYFIKIYNKKGTSRIIKFIKII